MELLQTYKKLYNKIKFLADNDKLNDKSLKEYNEILKSIYNAYYDYENEIFELQMQVFVLARQITEFHEKQKIFANNIIEIERRRTKKL
jgi:hypothetical protein